MILTNPEHKIFFMNGTDKAKSIEDLKQFLRFPSISTDSSKKSSVADCAKWLCIYLKKIGLQRVVLHPTKLHPIVYAEQIAHPSFKTILFYGHYDVQPVAPVSKWKYPPFEPVIINNHIYGRGASDDKGQLFIHVKAIEYIFKSQIPLKVNIKCLYEGEEEIGSPNLPAFILDFKKMLACDAAVVSDTKMLSADIPAITYSLRGSLNAEIIIRGQSKDLHSGTFGGMVLNPVDILCRMVSGLTDAYGKISIPGFYSDVLPVSQNERWYMKKSAPSDAVLLKDAGVKNSWGEPGFTNYERTTIRPSAVVTTLVAGYTGEGSKNAIPSEASMKLNIRLAPRQNPGKIASLLNSYFKTKIPDGFKFKIRYSSPTSPVEVSRTNIYVQAAANAYTKAFTRQPVFLRSGGTIPVVSMLTNELNVTVVMMGFALISDNMHAPDEKFYLPNFFRGIETIAEFIQNISNLK